MSSSEWKVGIVGGSGFVGSALVRHLSASFAVKVIDVLEPRDLCGVSYERCDIRGYEQVRDAVEGLDLVIHTAIIQIPQINERKRFAYEVNVLGTQNVCKAVDESVTAKGLILTGSWHVIGERGLTGTINEEFGFRPDKVEERARLYALSKVAQELLVRHYDEMSEKVFGVIRLGTVLGEGMPEGTAASIFINKGLNGEPITPFKHSMYRPMLYIDLNDVCSVYEKYARTILEERKEVTDNSLEHVVNAYYPKPITIIELAVLVKETISRVTNGKISPTIEIVDENAPLSFQENSGSQVSVDTTKLETLCSRELIPPEVTVERIVLSRVGKNASIPESVCYAGSR